MADLDETDQGQSRDRLAHGRAADAECLGELPLGRHAASRLDPT